MFSVLPPCIKGSIMGERAMIRSFVSAYLKCYMRELGSHHSKKSTFFSNSKAKSIFFVKLSSRHNAYYVHAGWRCVEKHINVPHQKVLGMRL